MNKWSSFTKRITVDAPIPVIYQAWATQAGLETWFLRRAIFTSADSSIKDRNNFIEKGDKYEWLWFGYPDSVVERRTILDCNDKDYIQFIFSGDCKVSVQIKTEHEENVVELIQSDIPEDTNPFTNLYVGCGEGWTFYLTNLKSVLEGGNDLRNKNFEIHSVINS